MEVSLPMFCVSKIKDASCDAMSKMNVARNGALIGNIEFLFLETINDSSGVRTYALGNTGFCFFWKR